MRRIGNQTRHENIARDNGRNDRRKRKIRGALNTSCCMKENDRKREGVSSCGPLSFYSGFVE